MSHLTIGLAEELRGDRIAVHGLWPRTLIDTQATRVFAEWFDTAGVWRSPDIIADACHALVSQAPAGTPSGRLWLDEEVLVARGLSSFEHYEVPNPLTKRS
jgi:citronellol/citronellal dehydrogenase